MVLYPMTKVTGITTYSLIKGDCQVSENIHLRVSKAKKDEMAAQAAREGLSMTGFILAAVNDALIETITVSIRYHQQWEA